MKKKKIYLLVLFALILAAAPALSGCAADRVMGFIPAGVFYPVKVSLVSPANGATDVSTNVVVKASFNEALNALSFNKSTFLLIGPNGESVVTGKDVPKTKEEALEKGYELDKEE